MGELKKIRLAKGLTLKEMAESLEMSESFYQKLEYGIKYPSLKTLKKIKEVYEEIDLNKLINF